MESTVTNKDKIELLQITIQQLIESKEASDPQNPVTGGGDDDNGEDRHLLAKLLSQLESLKRDGVIKPIEPSTEPNETPSSTISKDEIRNKDESEPSASNTRPDAEDVVKELKKLERQNRLTHWLLSGLILLTVAWQLSEVSLLLKLKEGMTHPFKSFGSIITGLLKRPADRLEEEKQLSIEQNGTENPLKLAMDLPSLMMNGDQE